VGTAAMYYNTTGANNTAVGKSALDANTTASNNTAIGYNAMVSNTTGSENTAMGRLALDANTTGSDNVAIGNAALSAVTTASNNTALGSGAGGAITEGIRNTCLGASAGDATTTGSSNIIIGYNSDVSAVDGNNQFVLGNGVTSVGNGNFTFGDGTTDSNIAHGGTTITAPSDVRLKEDIQDATTGLGFINDLRPVTFRWKQEQDVPEEMKAYVAGSSKRVMNEHHNHGFIAQEVKAVIDNHSDIKEGFDMWTEDATDGRQRLGDAALMPIMVKAVQELSTKLDAALARIATLEG
jgi:hypothetical protein